MKKDTLLVMAVLALSLAGCRQGGHDHHDHAAQDHHVHVAPHGGTLVALSDEFANMEFVLESESGTLTAYALDAHAENPVRLSQDAIVLHVSPPEAGPFTVTLLPVENPLTGETAGNTSEYRAQSENLKGVKRFDARVEEVHFKGQVLTQTSFVYPEGND